MSIINWRVLSAPRTAGFLLKQRFHSLVDRKFAKRRRDEAVYEHVRDHTTPGDPVSVLNAMDDFAQKQRWLMNIGPEKGAILLQALAQVEARNVLEIGAYCGYSATLIGQDIRQRDGKLTSLEISSKHIEIAQKIVTHAGLEDCVTFRKGTLSSQLDALQGPFDAVLLDHWKDEYLPDLKRLEAHQLIGPGSVIIADNIGFFAVPEYLGYVRESAHYESRFEKASVEYQEKLEDGVEVSVYLGNQEGSPTQA